jgi:hypothetical protein
MAKVYSIHYFELKPDVSAETLEQFLAANPFPTLPGWTSYYLKGERGERGGKYALVHEFESAEIRDHYFPKEDGEPHPEFQELLNSPKMQYFRANLTKYATSLMYAIYTDYRVIG